VIFVVALGKTHTICGLGRGQSRSSLHPTCKLL
jgi:hypothetical protein